MENKKRQGLIIVLIVATLFFFSIISAASVSGQKISIIKNSAKISDEVKKKIESNSKINLFSIITGAKGSVRVIVKTTNIQETVHDTGIVPIEEAETLGIIIGTFTTDEIAKLAEDSNTIKVFEDVPVQVDLAQSTDLIKAQPADVTHNNFGEGVKVCIIDTGIDDSHPYLKQLPADHKTSFGGYGTSYDGNGHGTHIAGIIMADSSRATRLIDKKAFQGVAPEVDLYVVKALSDSGGGYMSSVIQGMSWCAEQDVDVISMSLNGGAYNDMNLCNARIECQVIKGIEEYADVIFVASAGNSGAYELGVPACCEGVISVGSTDKNNLLSSFSNKYEELDVVAPGSGITSTFPKKRVVSLSGTSMAVPHVAGILALIKSINPSFSKEQIISLMEDTTIDLGLSKEMQGYGLINAFGACLVTREGEPGLTDCSDTLYSGIQINTIRNKLSLKVLSDSWIKVPQFSESETNLNKENYFYRYKSISTSRGFILPKNFVLIGEIQGNKIYMEKNLDNYEIYLLDENSKNSAGLSTKYYIYRQVNLFGAKGDKIITEISKDIFIKDYTLFEPAFQTSGTGGKTSECTEMFDSSYQQSSCIFS